MRRREVPTTLREMRRRRLRRLRMRQLNSDRKQRNLGFGAVTRFDVSLGKLDDYLAHSCWRVLEGAQLDAPATNAGCAVLQDPPLQAQYPYP